MPKYEHLPRIELHTLDGGLVAVRTRPLSESVLVIGPAVDGPTERVVSLDNLPVPEQLFGPTNFTTDYTRPTGVSSEDPYNGNALIKGLREVLAGGVADVRLLRVGGKKASGTHSQSDNAASGTITIDAIFGGRLYNAVSVQFTSGATSGKCVISQPDVKGGDFTFTWSGSTSGLTIKELIDKLNRDGKNRTVRFTAGTVDTSQAARLLNGTTALTGGLDGTIKDDADYRKNLYSALTDATSGAFQYLEDENYEIDVVFLSGIYLDDQVTDDGDAAKTTTSIATKFADYLGKRSVDYPQLGVIGVRPLRDISSRSKINEHYDALVSETAGSRGTASEKWIKAGYFMHTGFKYVNADMGLDIDAGGYLQVVAADVIFNDRELGLYIESAAGIYAGTIARLRPHKAASNETVRGIFEVPYFFTREQLNTMSGGLGRDISNGDEGAGGYVTIRRHRGIVFTRDVTAAFRKSDFSDLQPLRIANAVHKGIKDIAHPYLGQTNDLALRLGLETQIKAFLDGLADARALLGAEGIGYTLQVLGGDTDPLSNLLGILHINVVLRPALQVKEIRVRVRMSL